MGPRPRLMLAGLAVAALAPFSPVGYGAADSPMHADIGPVKCEDLSSLAQAFPMAGQFEGDMKRVAMVPVDIRTQPTPEGAHYEIHVDGKRRTSGSVGSEGTAKTNISVDNGKDSRVEVLSGKDVVADKMVNARC